MTQTSVQGQSTTRQASIQRDHIFSVHRGIITCRSFNTSLVCAIINSRYTNMIGHILHNQKLDKLHCCWPTVYLKAAPVGGH